MKPLFTSALVFAALLGTGCAPDWHGLQLAGPGADEYRDVVRAGDVTVVCGYRNGVLGQENLEPSGDAEAFVLALDAHGEKLWEKTFQTPDSDTLDALVVEGAFVYGVGRTRGAFPGFVNAGQVDAFVVEVPLSGVGETRLVQFGSEVPEHPTRIAVDVDGALLVAGYDDIYVPSNYVDRWENVLTARVLRSGAQLQLEWQRHTDTEISDLGFGLAPTGVAGELFLAGTHGNGAEDGPFVRRISASGEVLWNVRVENIGLDAVTALQLGPDGLLYAAGSTFTQLGAQAFGQQDAFVLVLDPATGARVRAMQGGSAESEWPWDLAISDEGEIFVTGGTLGALSGFEFAGRQDAFVMRFSAEGEWTGSWQTGGPGWDDPYAVALGENGTVYVAGSTEDSLVESATFGGVIDGFLSVVPKDALTR